MEIMRDGPDLGQFRAALIGRWFLPIDDNLPTRQAKGFIGVLGHLTLLDPAISWQLPEHYQFWATKAAFVAIL